MMFQQRIRIRIQHGSGCNCLAVRGGQTNQFAFENCFRYKVLEIWWFFSLEYHGKVLEFSIQFSVGNLVLKWQVFFSFKTQSTLNFPAYFFLKSYNCFYCLSENARQISCCPSEHRIGIRTMSEFLIFWFRLAPLDSTHRVAVWLPRRPVQRLSACARGEQSSSEPQERSEKWPLVLTGSAGLIPLRDGETGSDLVERGRHTPPPPRFSCTAFSIERRDVCQIWWLSPKLKILLVHFKVIQYHIKSCSLL